MADENQTTDVTSSEAETQDATQTDAGATSGQDSSTTEQKSDPLDGGTILTGDEEVEGAEGEKAEGEQAKEAEAPSLTGAPEGDYEITGLPEGMTIDADALAAAAPIFRELDLSNEGASKLAQVYAEKVLPGVQAQVQSGLTDQIVAQRNAWDAETRAAISGGKDADGAAIAADPAFNGKAYDEVVATSAKALDRFGGQPFREFLGATGLGNHPAMVKFAFLAGSAISEDTSFERSGGIPQGPKTEEEKFYNRST